MKSSLFSKQTNKQTKEEEEEEEEEEPTNQIQSHQVFTYALMHYLGAFKNV